MNAPLNRDVLVAKAIASQIQAAGIDADDPDFEALISSECDAVERLRRILRYGRHVEAQAKALAEMQAEMRDRKARLDARAEALRSAVRWAMSEIGLKRIEAPDFDVTLSSGRPKVIITDEALIPDNLCRIKREPDKVALFAELTRASVPGAELGNGTPLLTVRSK